MTTTTHDRPLPTDWAGLRAYLPRRTRRHRRHPRPGPPSPASTPPWPPCATSWSPSTRTGGRHHRGARPGCRRGRRPGPILAAYRPGRAHAEQRLAVLDRARNLAVHRLAVAERTDPVHLEWKHQCEQATREWSMVMASETSRGALRRARRLRRTTLNHACRCMSVMQLPIEPSCMNVCMGSVSFGADGHPAPYPPNHLYLGKVQVRRCMTSQPGAWR